MALKIMSDGSPEGTVIEEVMTLQEAAKRLERSPRTLMGQLRFGVFHATKSGSIYITTASEVERYRREHLGRMGPRRHEE